MDKRKLIPEERYLWRHKAVMAGREVEAERWITCIQVMQKGAVFACEDKRIDLTDEQIQKELREKY